MLQTLQFGFPLLYDMLFLLQVKQKLEVSDCD